MNAEEFPFLEELKNIKDSDSLKKECNDILDEFHKNSETVYTVSELLMNYEGESLAGVTAGIINSHANAAQKSINKLEELIRKSINPLLPFSDLNRRNH